MSEALAPTPSVSLEELRGSGPIVVFDTEFTAWEGSAQRGWSGPGEYQEIVQIGAVKVDGETWQEVAEFSMLVRPVLNPLLSDYFVNLTGITQKEVDIKGSSLEHALDAFTDFLQDANWVLANGEDVRIIEKNCVLRQIPCPLPKKIFRNLHPLLPQLLNGDAQPISSCRLVEFVGELGNEQAHQALSDARTIARTLEMLRRQSRI